MRDKKRKESKLLEEAYGKVCNEMIDTDVIVTQEPIDAVEVETTPCDAVTQMNDTSIDEIAHNAITAIYELAKAAGSSIVVDIQTEEEVVGLSNIGYEDIDIG